MFVWYPTFFAGLQFLGGHHLYKYFCVSSVCLSVRPEILWFGEKVDQKKLFENFHP